MHRLRTNEFPIVAAVGVGLGCLLMTAPAVDGGTYREGGPPFRGCLGPTDRGVKGGERETPTLPHIQVGKIRRCNAPPN